MKSNLQATIEKGIKSIKITHGRVPYENYDKIRQRFTEYLFLVKRKPDCEGCTFIICLSRALDFYGTAVFLDDFTGY
jgi:hypothetical protein